MGIKPIGLIGIAISAFICSTLLHFGLPTYNKWMLAKQFTDLGGSAAMSMTVPIYLARKNTPEDRGTIKEIDSLARYSNAPISEQQLKVVELGLNGLPFSARFFDDSASPWWFFCIDSESPKASESATRMILMGFDPRKERCQRSADASLGLTLLSNGNSDILAALQMSAYLEIDGINQGECTRADSWCQNRVAGALAAGGHTALLAKFVRSGVDVNKSTSFYVTEGDWQRDADYDPVERKDVTLLMRAAQRDRTETMNFLIKSGAMANAVDEKCETAMNYGFSANNKKKYAIASLLIAAGYTEKSCSQNFRGRTLFGPLGNSTDEWERDEGSNVYHLGKKPTESPYNVAVMNGSLFFNEMKYYTFSKEYQSVYELPANVPVFLIVESSKTETIPEFRLFLIDKSIPRVSKLIWRGEQPLITQIGKITKITFFSCFSSENCAPKSFSIGNSEALNLTLQGF